MYNEKFRMIMDIAIAETDGGARDEVIKEFNRMVSAKRIPHPSGHRADTASSPSLIEQTAAINASIMLPQPDPNRGGRGNSRGEAHPAWLSASSVPLRIVCGPPGAGKSTYVQSAKADGDAVIDLDQIASSISGEPEHGWHHRWLVVALRRRNELLAGLSQPSGPEHTAWLIVCEPNGRMRQWWNDKFMPIEIVLVLTDKDICINRVTARPFYQVRQASAVEQWFMDYTPRSGDRIISCAP